jgi:hypothetical protein
MAISVAVSAIVGVPGDVGLTVDARYLATPHVAAVAQAMTIAAGAVETRLAAGSAMLRFVQQVGLAAVLRVPIAVAETGAASAVAFCANHRRVDRSIGLDQTSTGQHAGQQEPDGVASRHASGNVAEGHGLTAQV